MKNKIIQILIVINCGYNKSKRINNTNKTIKIKCNSIYIYTIQLN